MNKFQNPLDALINHTENRTRYVCWCSFIGLINAQSQFVPRDESKSSNVTLSENWNEEFLEYQRRVPATAPSITHDINQTTDSRLESVWGNVHHENARLDALIGEFETNWMPAAASMPSSYEKEVEGWNGVMQTELESLWRQHSSQSTLIERDLEHANLHDSAFNDTWNAHQTQPSTLHATNSEGMNIAAGELVSKLEERFDATPKLKQSKFLQFLSRVRDCEIVVGSNNNLIEPSTAADALNLNDKWLDYDARGGETLIQEKRADLIE